MQGDTLESLFFYICSETIHTLRVYAEILYFFLKQDIISMVILSIFDQCVFIPI